VFPHFVFSYVYPSCARLYLYVDSIKQLGCVNQEAINRAKILVSSQDFDEGLDTIQGVQSLDLGTPKVCVAVIHF